MPRGCTQGCITGKMLMPFFGQSVFRTLAVKVLHLYCPSVVASRVPLRGSCPVRLWACGVVAHSRGALTRQYFPIGAFHYRVFNQRAHPSSAQTFYRGVVLGGCVPGWGVEPHTRVLPTGSGRTRIHRWCSGINCAKCFFAWLHRRIITISNNTLTRVHRTMKAVNGIFCASFRSNNL